MPSSSASVRAQTVAATIEPAEAPEMTRGRAPASISAATTPRWYVPSPAPPERSSAVRPCACLHSLKNASRASKGTDSSSVSDTKARAETAAATYASTTNGAPILALSNNRDDPMPCASRGRSRSPRIRYIAAWSESEIHSRSAAAAARSDRASTRASPWPPAARQASPPSPWSSWEAASCHASYVSAVARLCMGPDSFFGSRLVRRHS
mmetsp:Transcript_9502/g.33439  ORF Transcript_9502/g.33439 Transcript_9502/m.33439 type:complete len:209 (+) Transcript_9502:1956-2582(+)